MDWGILINQSVISGLALSAILTVLLVAGLRVNPEIFYNDYPEEIKKAYGPMSDAGRRQRTPFTILLFGMILAAMIVHVNRLGESLGGAPSFAAVFVSVSIVYLIFSLIDAFIIDWLILMVLWPGLAILPGTEGMAGYHDMRAWARDLLKSIPISVFMGLITAGVSSLVVWVGTLV
jgi:hypothetical protein